MFFYQCQMFNSFQHRSIDPRLYYVPNSVGKDHILDMTNPMSNPEFREEYMKKKE